MKLYNLLILCSYFNNLYTDILPKLSKVHHSYFKVEFKDEFNTELKY